MAGVARYESSADELAQAAFAGSERSDIRELPPHANELPGLEEWLAQGLRSGRTGRVAAEYPLVFEDFSSSRHVLLRAGNRFLSHALVEHVVVEAGCRDLALSMVGLVYTEPRARRRGLASRCLAICEARARRAGSGLLALWTDRPEFYARLGFAAGGGEIFVRVDPSCARRALRSRSTDTKIRAADSQDWAALEALYSRKPVHVRRRPGALARLATIPDCRLVVSERRGRPVAYAAIGKGDDFPAVVHEWAGECAGVLGCLAELIGSRTPEGLADGRTPAAHPGAGAVVLAGPVLEEPIAALCRAGCAAVAHPFAMLRLLDPERVWRTLAYGVPRLERMRLSRMGTENRIALYADGAYLPMSHETALQLLFGPDLPENVMNALAPASRDAIRERLPWPLFVWGFDSI